jgi:hypothetical protein
VNEKRAELYARLMDAQDRIAQALYRRGVPDAFIQSALDQADERLNDDERREDLYVSALARYVEALGGHVEIRAKVGDAVVVVRREPPGPS